MKERKRLYFHMNNSLNTKKIISKSNKRDDRITIHGWIGDEESVLQCDNPYLDFDTIEKTNRIFIHLGEKILCGPAVSIRVMSFTVPLLFISNNRDRLIIIIEQYFNLFGKHD